MPKGQVPIGKYIHLKQEVEKVAYQNGFDAGVEKAYKEGFQAGQQTNSNATGQLTFTQNELEQVRKQLQVAHDDFWEMTKLRDEVVKENKKFKKAIFHLKMRITLVNEILNLDLPDFLNGLLLEMDKKRYEKLRKGDDEDASRPSGRYDSEPGRQDERSRN